MGSCCILSRLLCRCRHSDGRHCACSLRHRPCLGRSRCWYGLHLGSNVSVRVLSQVDPWCRRRPLPVGYYYRAPPRRRFQQCYQEPTQSLLLSHSRRYSVYLGSNSCWWNGRPSRGVCFRPNSLLNCTRLKLFQSPRWLIKKHRDVDAARALSRLTSLPTDDPEVLSELEEIRLNLKHEEELGESTYVDCFRSTDNRIRFRTLTGIFLQAWQQLTGINFIFYFGTTFFTNAGIHNPFLITIATSTVNVGMTLPGLWGVERFGRRRLLLVGAIGMTVCEFIIAIIGSTTAQSNQSAQSALVAFVCFYIAFFASTWGPIAWVITGEIFPLKIRAKAMSLSTASNWLWNWAIAYSSEYLLLLRCIFVPILPICQHRTWSTLAKETQTWVPRCSTSGARRVSAVSSLHTSAFPRQRVSLLNKSTCCTRTLPLLTRSRTASDSSLKVLSFQDPDRPLAGVTICIQTRRFRMCALCTP